MVNLDIALGFATVMFFLATVVKFASGLVERRRTYYCNMIDDFLEAAQATFQTRGLTNVDTERLRNALDGAPSSRGRTNITIDDAISLLAREIGKEFKDQAADLSEDLRRDFKIADGDATETFRRHKRIINSLLGVVIALLLNIDSLTLFQLLVNEDAYRQQVITVSIDDVEKLRTQLEDKADGEEVSLPDAIDAIRANSEGLGRGAFVLYDEFPYWPSRLHGELTDTERKARSEFQHWALWLLGILITGLMAGLGSPFWHDVIQGLSTLGAGKKTAGSGRGAGHSIENQDTEPGPAPANPSPGS